MKELVRQKSYVCQNVGCYQAHHHRRGNGLKDAATVLLGIDAASLVQILPNTLGVCQMLPTAIELSNADHLPAYLVATNYLLSTPAKGNHDYSQQNSLPNRTAGQLRPRQGVQQQNYHLAGGEAAIGRDP